MQRRCISFLNEDFSTNISYEFEQKKTARPELSLYYKRSFQLTLISIIRMFELHS